MKTSSLPNLNRETISFPTFFSLIQDPDHHDDTTLNKRPKIDNSQYTEASDTSPLKVASAHVNNNNSNDHRALDAASALMDDAQSCCGSNSYGGDVEDCSFGSPSRSGYSVSNDGNTSTSRIGSGSWVHQSFGPNRVPHSFPSLATATQGRDSLVNSEIRSVLDLMRRGEGLRFEVSFLDVFSICINQDMITTVFSICVNYGMLIFHFIEPCQVRSMIDARELTPLCSCGFLCIVLDQQNEYID